MSKRKRTKSGSAKPKASVAKRAVKAKPTTHPKPAGDGHLEIISRGCLVQGSRVLLCRNLKHGYLYLPGGHVEFGESAAAALAREFLEECALPIRVGPLALASEGSFNTRKKHHHEINLVFLVEQLGKAQASRGGQPAPIKSREEGIAFDWIELAAVPDTDIRPIAAKAWLAGGGGTGRIEWVSEFPA